MMPQVHVREAAGALLRSCDSAAGPEQCPRLAGSQLAFGSNSEPASLRDRPGHGSGLFGGSAHLPSGTPHPPRRYP